MLPKFPEASKVSGAGPKTAAGPFKDNWPDCDNPGSSMWFKNLFVFRLAPDWDMNAARLDEALAAHPLQPCGGFDLQSVGWLPPRDNGGFVHAVQRQWLISLGVEQKLLPAAVVAQVTQERAAELEERQGFKVGRKQLRDLKDSVTEELLPRAFARRRRTWAWLDTVNGWLVVDAAGESKAEELLKALNDAVPGIPARRLEVERAPGSAMTGWLVEGEAPAGFTIDRDLELTAPGEEKATVRYLRHALDGDEIRAHIAEGKTATRLGMTWNDRISFLLTGEGQLKRLAFLDILKEDAERQAETADEQFDVDFVLMSGELARLLADLVDALGGERPPAV